MQAQVQVSFSLRWSMGLLDVEIRKTYLHCTTSFLRLLKQGDQVLCQRLWAENSQRWKTLVVPQIIAAHLTYLLMNYPARFPSSFNSDINYKSVSNNLMSKFQPCFHSTTYPEFFALQMYLMDNIDKSNSTLTLRFNIMNNIQMRNCEKIVSQLRQQPS